MALDVATRFLNSNFTVAAIGALAGAYAGARDAQHIAERNKRKEMLVAELNATNSAIMLSFTVCNSALGLKKQIVRPLYDGFMRDKAAYIEHIEKARSDPKAGRFAYTANLISFLAPLVPIDVLRDLVLQRTSAYGKAAGLVPLVQNAASGLTDAIRQREDIITHFKTGRIPEADQHWHYFGEKSPSGHTYREYSDVVEVIHSYTNDLIYFSAALCDALVQHGKSAIAGLKHSPQDVPKVNEPDFSGPKKTGLFPPDSDYSSWQAWIVERNDQPAR
jgi:hypothetical protein